MEYLHGIGLISKFVKEVFPIVDKELNKWVDKSNDISDSMLKKQALLSISKKKFHVQGGSIYSLYPGADTLETVRFITAFQTISDYLDNLCDRSGVYDEKAFRLLHEAMNDAVSIGFTYNDYYSYYPYKTDNGYLSGLVEECRRCIRKLPSYSVVEASLKDYVKNYASLQALKHLSDEIREVKLKGWASSLLSPYPDLFWWEFSAAAGSTLGIFLLFSAAQDPDITSFEVESINEAYFPWVSGLHILLDYLIDMDEDKKNNDLNFFNYYENSEQSKIRLLFFIKKSFEKCSKLKYPGFHHTVIRGLLAMYLSDKKAVYKLKYPTNYILKNNGIRTKFYYWICRFLRLIHHL